MSHFETSLLFQVWFYPLLLDLDLQVSQETWKVVWYSQIFKIFQFVVIHIVKDFRVIDEVNFFLEFFCFFYDPMDVSNLISGSSAFSKSRIYTWTFMVSWAVKSGLQLSLDLAAAAKSLQSCLTLCDPIDGSPPGSPIPGILQARTLEWVAISFSNAWKWKVKVKSLSCVRLLATPWTAAYQAPPSMGFPRQEYWSGLPLPSLGFSSYLSLFPINYKWTMEMHCRTPVPHKLRRAY